MEQAGAHGRAIVDTKAAFSGGEERANIYFIAFRRGWHRASRRICNQAYRFA